MSKHRSMAQKLGERTLKQSTAAIVSAAAAAAAARSHGGRMCVPTLPAVKAKLA